MEEARSTNGKVLLVAGNSNPELVRAIAEYKPGGGRLIDCEVGKFADGEISVSIEEPVRGADVFIIEPTCKYGDNDVNDSIMELLVLVDACRRASARRITAVMPYFAYARQDRKAKSRDPISAKLVANMITAAGANRVLTMDLHTDQIQGFFDIPVDNMSACRLLAEYYIGILGKADPDTIVVSPDVGSVKRARNFAQRLKVDLAIVDKRRAVANQSEVMNIVGDVSGRNVILFDDMVDTAGSLCNAASALKDNGAKDIYACASHGVLSDRALERIENSDIKILRLVDSIPYPKGAALSPKIQYISCAKMFAEGIEHIHSEQSISGIFN